MKKTSYSKSFLVHLSQKTVLQKSKHWKKRLFIDFVQSCFYEHATLFCSCKFASFSIILNILDFYIDCILPTNLNREKKVYLKIEFISTFYHFLTQCCERGSMNEILFSFNYFRQNPLFCLVAIYTYLNSLLLLVFSFRHNSIFQLACFSI